MITGAARGIGRACSLELVQRGAYVVLNDAAHQEELEELAASIHHLGGQAMVCLSDIADPESTTRMFEQAAQHFGRLDILINNAAVSFRKPFLEQSIAEVDRSWKVTQHGAFLCSQLAAKQMVKQRHGNIVMISSVHAERPYPNASPYNAAKAAINHLTQSIALELAPYGIRVNAIEPGWIDTPGERVHNTESEIQERGSMLPMGRLGRPEEVAKAAAWLCSEDASYVTGAILRVDGGFALKF